MKSDVTFWPRANGHLSSAVTPPSGHHKLQTYDENTITKTWTPISHSLINIYTSQ